jgi:hypothetical protein
MVFAHIVTVAGETVIAVGVGLTVIVMYLIFIHPEGLVAVTVYVVVVVGVAVTVAPVVALNPVAGLQP